MTQPSRPLDVLFERTARSIQEFLLRNARLLALAVVAGVFAHGYELTHLTFSIDEENLWQAPDDGEVWLGQHRWGMYLLRFVLPQAVYPFTSALLAIVFLSIASVLLLDRAPTRTSAKAVFCVLFVSFPTFAHIQYFAYMGAYVALAILIVVAAERLAAAACSGSVGLLLPASCALGFAVASHQSLLFAYVTLVSFTVTAEAFEGELTPKRTVRRLGFAALVLGGALVVFYGVDAAWGHRSNGYVESYFRWGTAPPSELLAAVYRAAVPFLTGHVVTYVSLQTVVVPFAALVFLALRSQRPALTVALTILFVLSPFAVHVAFGTWMSSRSMMAVPIMFAGLWSLVFSLGGPVIRGSIAVFTVYAAILHSSVISRVSLAQELTYKADSLVASRLLELVYDVQPRLTESHVPLAFVGFLDPPRSRLFVKDEAFGGSFWQWDGGNPYRMFLLLESLGMPTTVALAPETEWPRAKALAKGMPIWPDRNCVQLRGGLVIVKLSEVP